MIQTILTLWLVLSFPIAVSVDNKMAREGSDERHSFLWQLSLMKNSSQLLDNKIEEKEELNENFLFNF